MPINRGLFFNMHFLITKEIQILPQNFQKYMSRKKIRIAPTPIYQVTTKLLKFSYAWPATHSFHLFFSLHLELIHVTWLENDADYYVQSLQNVVQHNRGQVMNYFSGAFFLSPIKRHCNVSYDTKSQLRVCCVWLHLIY